MKAPNSIKYTIGKPMPGTKWVVRGELGQGGMGLVLDVEKGELIRGAMKVLLPPFATVPEFAAKFLDEIKVTARLQHPNIVQVVDFDRLSDGTPFMVMERLRGKTLRAVLQDTRERGKLWTSANTYAVAAQAAEGLYRAHSHEPSIVHGDVKPENLFLHRAQASFEVVVKVMDFGVAAVVGEGERQIVGTPRYMAPEQVTGGEVSPQTDQYALALVIYEMLTERLPWDVNLRDRKAVAEARCYAAPTPPSTFCPWLPASMDAALLQALAKDPRARHGTLHGLMFELRALQWIGITGEANTDDPMAATLAGGRAAREEHDLFEDVFPPRADQARRAAAGPSGAAAMEFSESSEPPTWPRPPGAGMLVQRPPAAMAEVPTADSEAITTAVRAEGSGAPHAIDTPMTGASGARPTPRIWGNKAARRTALGLVGAGAVGILLVSARIARSPRERVAGGVQLIESRTSGAAPVASDLGVGAEPPQWITEAAHVPKAAAESAVLPTIVVPAEPSVAKTTSARSDGGAGGPVLRRATLPPRPALRSPSVKPSVPDDGRDELYIPAVTR